MSGKVLDLQDFVAHATSAKADPVRVTKAARALVDGALRIRTGNDGIFGNVIPVTKPVEAVGAWLKSIERDMIGGDFQRENEAREALVVAAEEVDEAVKAVPKAARFQTALYADALGALAKGSSSSDQRSFWPWLLAAGLSGLLVGILFNLKRR